MNETTHEPKISGNCVAFPHARFSALTPSVLRLEYAADGVFADAPTLTCRMRAGSAEQFTVMRTGECWQFGSGNSILTYKPDGKPFSKGNLKVTARAGDMRIRWLPGMRNAGDLHGARRTLDSFHGNGFYDKEKKRIVTQAEEPGLLSRSGWALVDDSASPLLKPLPDGRLWPQARPAGERQDWYLLLHGRDYRAALKDCAKVFGGMPLTPRFTLGLWISRWWAYTDRELVELADEYDRHGCGLDVVIADMEWHIDGWSGYDWEKSFFPDHRRFLSEMAGRGLRVGLNLHPAGGVRRCESKFPAMAEATGTSPDAEVVPFDCTNPAYMDAYFKVLHHPYEKDGVSVWWMDWQQGRKSAIEGLDPLPWLNELHWRDQERLDRPEKRRPVIFSRYGGIGSGRYPIGFSGDTESSWRTLKYLVPFTAQSANVLYGQWSHDTGGFFEGLFKGRLTPELYLRWVQFSAHSPVIRTHAARIAHADRRFWLWGGPHGGWMLDAVSRRYELAAYLYTQNRIACDTAVAPFHPLYYDWPGRGEAYAAKGQHMLGDALMVAPVTDPCDPATNETACRLWLPPGEWYDMAHGVLRKGDATVETSYHLEETPVFARAGAVVPVFVGARRLGAADTVARLGYELVPGEAGEGIYFEDDGLAADYEKSGLWQTVRQRTSGARTEVEVEPARGTYQGCPDRRELSLRFLGAMPPRTVTVNGSGVERSGAADRPGWSWDGIRLALVVRIPGHDMGTSLKVEVAWEPTMLPGRGGIPAGAVRRCREAFHRLRETATPPMRKAGALSMVGRRIELAPETAAPEVAAFRNAMDEAVAAVNALTAKPDAKPDWVRRLGAAKRSCNACLASAMRIHDGSP